MQNLKLKGLRAENKLRQIDMAAKLGISEPAYINKENGKNEFTVSEVNIILKFFPGVKYEDIFLK